KSDAWRTLAPPPSSGPGYLSWPPPIELDAPVAGGLCPPRSLLVLPPPKAPLAVAVADLLLAPYRGTSGACCAKASS
ncbi:hypothetical protein KI387_016099, partial [Taxus chinensis]